MKVNNCHERKIQATISEVGELIDSLASVEDKLWPFEIWPRMKFDRGLTVDAVGGHGPIRYFVAQYCPGQSVRFCFTGPQGFNGYHEFVAIELSAKLSLLRHNLKMETTGLAVLSWPLVFRPLHDALIEDAFAKAQTSLGLPPEIYRWSLRVKLLRQLVAKGKSRPQIITGSS